MKSYLGINISDNTIEAIELRKETKAYAVSSYSRIRVKSGIIVEGNVIDKKVFQDHLKKLFQAAKPRAFRTKQVVLSIPDSKVYSHNLKVPLDLHADALDEYIKKEVEGILPFDFYEILWTYRVLKTNKKNKEILWVGTEKSIVAVYLETLKKLGYQVVCIESESEALFRLFCDKIAKPEAVCLVDLGSRIINLSIFDQRGLISTYGFKGAGDNWTEKISKQESLSFVSAEKLKKSVGLDTNNKYGKIVLILLRELEKVVAEIKKSIDFYEKVDGQQVTKIILTGGSSKLKELGSYIKDNFEIDVDFGKPLIPIVGEKVSTAIYSVAMGLSIVSDSHSFNTKCTNLLPETTVVAIREQKNKQKRRLRKILIYGAITIFLTVFSVLAFYYRQKQAITRQQEISYQESIAEIEITNYSLNFNVKVDVSVKNDLNIDTQVSSSSSSVDTVATSAEKIQNNMINGRVVSGALELSDVYGVTGQKSIANKQISVLIDADIERAEKTLLQKIEYEYLLQVLTGLQNLNEETVVSHAIDIEKVYAYSDTKVGSIAGSFVYTAKANVAALVLINQELEALVDQNLAIRLTAGDKASNYNFSDFQLTLIKYDKENKIVEINVKSVASRKE